MCVHVYYYFELIGFCFVVFGVFFVVVFWFGFNGGFVMDFVFVVVGVVVYLVFVVLILIGVLMVVKSVFVDVCLFWFGFGVVFVGLLLMFGIMYGGFVGDGFELFVVFGFGMIGVMIFGVLFMVVGMFFLIGVSFGVIFCCLGYVVCSVYSCVKCDWFVCVLDELGLFFELWLVVLLLVDVKYDYLDLIFDLIFGLVLMFYNVEFDEFVIVEMYEL